MITDQSKSSFCGVVFLALTQSAVRVGHKHTNEKVLFNNIVEDAIKDIEKSDYYTIYTNDGVAISLLGEPEKALAVSFSIQDAVIAHNKIAKSPLMVRTGINLLSDDHESYINHQVKVIGNAIKNAECLMRYAKPGEVLVSSVTCEVASKLERKFSKRFSFLNIIQPPILVENEIHELSLDNDTDEDASTNSSGLALDSTLESMSQITRATSRNNTSAPYLYWDKENTKLQSRFLQKKYYVWGLQSALCATLLVICFNHARNIEVQEKNLQPKNLLQHIPSFRINPSLDKTLMDKLSTEAPLDKPHEALYLEKSRIINK